MATTTEAPRHLELGQRLLVHNDAQAAANREHFAAAGVRVINLLSSPGSGKTALLERLALELAPSSPAARHPMAVIVGDLATDNDARRLRAAGVPFEVETIERMGAGTTAAPAVAPVVPAAPQVRPAPSPR